MTIGGPIKECNQSISGILFKDWQFNITSDMRGDLVEHIVKAILPHNNSPAILSERRRISLLEFAHKIEKEHFDCSDSKEEYFYLIAKKIQHIRREFEERRLLRKIDNLNNNRRFVQRTNLVNNLIMKTNNSSRISFEQQQKTTRNMINHQQQQQQQLNSILNQSSSMATISTELRQKIIKRILHVIFPLQRAIYDIPQIRFLHLIKYAHKIETDCYLRATNKENYFQLIAERLQKILIELKLNIKRAKQNDDSNSEIKHNEMQMNRSKEFNRFNVVDLNSVQELESRNQSPKTDDTHLSIKSSTSNQLNALKNMFGPSIEASGNL